jgi:hypothetical protein
MSQFASCKATRVLFRRSAASIWAGLFARRRPELVFTFAAWLATTLTVAANQPAGHSFDDAGTVWHLQDDNRAARILAHDHIPGGARNENGCERLVISAPAGQSTHLACAMPRIAVLDELQVCLWVKSARSNVQLAARVVMPRSTDNRGRPASAVVRGSLYGRPGHWQQLILKDVPKLLSAEVRVMRSVPGAKIDSREAFLDCVVLIIPGDPLGVEVVTDELDVEGVAVGSDAVQLASFPASRVATMQASTAGASIHSEPAVGGAGDQSSPRLKGSLLIVDGKPFLPRATQWRGEPLQFLANLGFNTIQLPTAPTEEQVAEARRFGLWLICAPPRPDQIRAQQLGQPGDRVLAWYLEEDAYDGDGHYAQTWTELIRQHDAVAGRPVILPLAPWLAAGNAAEILAAHNPFAARIPVADYNEWLSAELALHKPGIPFFACIPTQWSDRVRQQAAALTGTAAGAVSVDADQIEGLVHAAGMHGCGGFVFASQSPLNENKTAARMRAATLELINRRLQLIERWLAAGSMVGQVNSVDSAWTAVVLHVDHARLLIPSKAEFFANGLQARNRTNTPGENVVFLVPGIPESSQAFSLSAVALRPLPAQRVAGGTRIVLPADDCRGFVLLTEDPVVIQSFRQRIARDGPRVARLERDLAELQANAAAETHQRLARIGIRGDHNQRQVASVASQLRQAHTLLASGRVEPAHQLATSARRSLARLAGEERSRLGLMSTTVSHPLAMSFEQLSDYTEFSQSLSALQSSENLLYGGDFEDLGQMTQWGWQHVRHATSGVEAGAKLSPRNPQHGTYCLELFALAPAESSGLVGSPPVWVVSPPMPVEEGSVVEINGWVRVEEANSGSANGLQILDSLGGDELSLAVRETSGWQPFQMIRGVPNSTELRLTFALSGRGLACIDGVMVRVLQRPAARRLPATSPVDRSATIEGEVSGPLFPAAATR